MPGWITPASVHSVCGYTAGNVPGHFIDRHRGRSWSHVVTETHWIVLDLGGSATIQRIRLYQLWTLPCKWHGVDVYVSDIPGDWGAPVATNLTFNISEEWEERNVAEKKGRYIKLAEIDTQDSRNYVAGTEFEVYIEEGEVPSPPPSPPIPSTLCDFFDSVGSYFEDLAVYLDEIWLLGRYLVVPFETLGELFHYGAEQCRLVIAAFNAALANLEDVVSAADIVALVRENFPTLAALVDDPNGWFLVQLTQVLDLEPWHTQSLEFLAKWILEEYFPTLYQIWLDPLGEIVRWVSQYSSFIAGLFIDPAKQIRWTVGEILGILPGMYDHPEAWPEMLFKGHFPELYAFWLDPEAWLVEHVDPRVRDIPEAIAAFIADPWGWLFDRLEDQIETYVVRIGELAAEIIAQLLGV